LRDGYFHFQIGFGMGCFFFNLSNGHVGLEITGFGTGCKFLLQLKVFGRGRAKTL
jgi:hypothetical protein